LKKIVLTALVMILAISLSGVIHMLGKYWQPYGVSSVAIYGNYAYITNVMDSGITILDISNPADPQFLDTYFAETGGNIRIYGNRAYVSGIRNGSNIVQILDLSDPVHPEDICQIPLHPGNICKQGNYLYLAAYDEGYYILDISNLPNYGTVYSAHGYYDVLDMEVVGDYAYLAIAGGGLEIMNVADPQHPQTVGQYNTPGRAQHVSVQGNKAYIGDSSGGLQIIDISNPANPVILSNFATAGSTTYVCVENNIAYVTEGTGVMEMIDVSDPLNPVLISSYFAPQQLCWMELRDGIAYLANWNEGFQILDVSYPQNPALLSQINPEQPMYDSAASGSLACVAKYQYGMDVYDRTNPQNPVLISHTDVEPDAVIEQVVLSGSMAYVMGFKFMYNEGDTGYFGISLWVVNLANPANPVVMGRFRYISTDYYYEKVLQVNGNCAYMGFRDDLYIIDVSNPANPTQVGFYSGIPYTNDLCVHNNIACVTYCTDVYTPEYGLQVIGISNPQAPETLGVVTNLGVAYSVAVSGNIAYVANGQNGVQMIDISNPSAPFITGNLPTRHHGKINTCRIFNNRLYVADTNWNEVQIYDISNPQQVSLITRYDWNLPSQEIYVEGNALFSGCSLYGLSCLDLNAVSIDDPVLPEVNALQLKNYPNPFNPQTCFQFELPNSSAAEIKIYNLKGQLVCTLASEVFSKGTNRVYWDGTDNDHKPVSSGVYICRLRSGKHSQVCKTVLLK